MITAHKVDRKNRDFKKVIEVYREAFPKIEQLPVWFLRMRAMHKGVEYLSLREDDEFIGFTYLTHYNGSMLIYFLATDEKLRGKGYGSKVIKWIKEYYTNEKILVIMETVHEESENSEQRKIRKDFYLRNGFKDTGCYMTDFSGDFDILSMDDDFDKESFPMLIKLLTFWVRKVEIKKW